VGVRVVGFNTPDTTRVPKNRSRLSRPDVDQARLLPRYRPDTPRTNHPGSVISAPAIPAVTHPGVAGGDPQTLRGIPCLAHGVSSTVRGSNPLSALINKHGEWTT